MTQPEPAFVTEKNGTDSMSDTPNGPAQSPPPPPPPQTPEDLAKGQANIDNSINNPAG